MSSWHKRCFVATNNFASDFSCRGLSRVYVYSPVLTSISFELTGFLTMAYFEYVSAKFWFPLMCVPFRSKPSPAAFVGCMTPFMLGVCFLLPSMDCLWHKYHYCPSCNQKVTIFYWSNFMFRVYFRESYVIWWFVKQAFRVL